MPEDERWMSRALELAEKGRYSVSPNPMVGCVIVRNDEVLGEGFHQRAGQPHAEIEALRSCSVDTAQATLYVTLEPCLHHGRTPPCLDALRRARLSRVVIATRDPTPEVNGRGVAALRKAGIAVTEGLLEDRAARLNEKFLHSARTRNPFVLVKAGMSLDGKLGTIDRRSRWITSPESRQRSLELREEYDAILVGSGTVIADDPRLTRRLGWNRSIAPWLRVVLEGDGSIPPSSNIFTDGEPTLLFTSRRGRGHAGETTEVVEMEAREGRIDLAAVLDHLGQRGVRSLIVEGGSLVLSEFLDRRLWQKLVLFIAPLFVGGSSAPSIFQSDRIHDLEDALRFRFDSVEPSGSDLMVTAYPTDLES